MNTVEKGDKLEDQLYNYLLDQRDRGELIFDVYPAALCQLHKKKKYFCKERGADVEFDVVIEVRRKGRSESHLFVIFECKNHITSIHERDVIDFSDKIGRIFGHASKGVFVSASRLQSGVENIARSRRLGIAKFDANGIDVIVDRTARGWAESNFLKSQLTVGLRRSKSLKFSAYYEGRYFSSPLYLLKNFEESPEGAKIAADSERRDGIPFVSELKIQEIAKTTRSHADYYGGEVNLEKICVALGLELRHSDQPLRDADESMILGSINFEKKTIEINKHDDRNRERFTIAHEIGHFCLNHGEYLRSETIAEHDLFVDTVTDDTFNYERLEYQANLFGSLLLLPEEQFMYEVEAQRRRLDIFDRGFGYIFVDDQPCNYRPYNQLLSLLSDHFGASNQAIEIRLKRAGLVNDHHKKHAQARR